MSGNINCSKVILGGEGVHKFHLYWTTNLVSKLGFDYDNLNNFEKKGPISYNRLMF